MKTSLASLLAAFQASFASRKDDAFRHYAGVPLYLGCETRRLPSEYRWDGLHRGESPKLPKVVFQCCLEGWGVFERGNRRWQVRPGQAFATVMPSPHLYYLPEESPVWSFYYLTFDHPELVRLLCGYLQGNSPVFDVPAGSRLHAQSFDLFDRTCHCRHEDEFAEEQALYDWAFAFGRHLKDLAHPRGPRRQLLEELRVYTLENLQRSFGVEEIAQRHGMSRSHFSHHFKSVTGISPAAYILEQRLGELRRLLRETELPLKDLADATGFADANHLCKAFRRHFHSSPGSYRRMGR